MGIISNNYYYYIYMDDIKLYAKNNDNLESLLNAVKKFIDDIVMQFDVDKSTKIIFSEKLIT